MTQNLWLSMDVLDIVVAAIVVLLFVLAWRAVDGPHERDVVPFFVGRELGVKSDP